MRAEGFAGEIDDVIAAADHVASLPWVDPERVYLAGHSTGGTLALLVAASTDRFAGVVAYGPSDRASGYGGNFVYADPDDPAEMRLRNPVHWMHTITTPTWVVEGTVQSNDHALRQLRALNDNPAVRYVLAEGHDHFSHLRPANTWFAEHLGEPPEGSETALATHLAKP